MLENEKSPYAVDVKVVDLRPSGIARSPRSGLRLSGTEEY
jgi:hypothetical protein